MLVITVVRGPPAYHRVRIRDSAQAVWATESVQVEVGVEPQSGYFGPFVTAKSMTARRSGSAESNKFDLGNHNVCERTLGVAVTDVA